MNQQEFEIVKIMFEQHDAYLNKNVPQTATKFGRIDTIGVTNLQCENGTISRCEVDIKHIEFIPYNKTQAMFKLKIKLI